MELSIAWEACGWGIASAVSLPLGALLGLWLKPGRKVGSSFTAFGAGALLFALTIELFGHVPHYVDEHGFGAFVAVGVGAIAGGLLFDVLNQYLNNRGAFLRRLSNARRHVAGIRIRRTKRLIEELYRVEVLHDVLPEQMAKIIQGGDEEWVNAGETVFSQGAEADALYFLIRGEVDIVRHQDGTEKEIATLKKHATFGEVALLEDTPRSAEARAVVDTLLYKIPKEVFDEFMEEATATHDAVRSLADARRSEVSFESSEDRDEDWREETFLRIASAQPAVSVDDIIEESSASGVSGAAMAIWLGILIDGVPESLVIGMLAKSASGISLAFIAGVFLANLPEAMSSAVSMARGGMGKPKIFLMWGSICLMTGIGAFLGASLFPADREGAVFFFVLAIEGVAAGAMLTMIAETMLPEAFEHGGAIVGLCTLAGFLTTLCVKVL